MSDGSSDTKSFSATRWNVVLAAAGDAADALAALCRAYWYPLYAFLQRQGPSTRDVVYGKSGLRGCAEECPNAPAFNVTP